MVSFAAVLFFAVTGLTLNHPDWFPSNPRTTVRQGQADLAALRSAGSAGIDKLKIVEDMRAREHVHGTVSDFRVDDTQVSLSMRAPGYTADVFIDRQTGKYDLTEVSNGFVAIINDLHKGRDAGRAWSFIVDASAIVLVFVSLTGLFLICFLHKRRLNGLMCAAAGLIAVCVIYKLMH